MRVLLVIIALAISTTGVFARDLAIQGGPGGGLFRKACPGLSYAKGITVKAGAWLDSVSVDCANYDDAANQLNGPAGNTGAAGGNGGGPKSKSCAPDQYISSIKYGFTRDDNRPKYADYIEFTCTSIANGSSTKMCLDSGDGCWDRHPSPGPYNGYGLAFASTCGPDEAMVGLVGRSGAFVDAMAAECGIKPVSSRGIARAEISAKVERQQFGGPKLCFKGKGFVPGGRVKIRIGAIPGVNGLYEFGDQVPGPDGSIKSGTVSAGSLTRCSTDQKIGYSPMIAIEEDGGGRFIAKATGQVASNNWCDTTAGGGTIANCNQ